jgi:hypothetical protein
LRLAFYRERALYAGKAAGKKLEVDALRVLYDGCVHIDYEEVLCGHAVAPGLEL